MNYKNMLFLALPVLMATSAQAADESQGALSVSYVKSDFTSLMDSDAHGVNVKYIVTPAGQSLGFGGTLTYTSGSHTTHNFNGTSNKYDLSYLSVGVGPSYQFGDYLTGYGMLAIVSTSSKFNGGSSSQDLTMSYGAGVQVKIWRQAFVDLYYEKVGMGRDAKIVDGSSYAVGVGYNF